MKTPSEVPDLYTGVEADRQGEAGRHNFASFRSKSCEKEIERPNKYGYTKRCEMELFLRQGRNFDSQAVGHDSWDMYPQACMETRKLHKLAAEAARQTLYYYLVY
jgi:hypothetical protein